ncbi:MAG: hypothetical protein R3B13_21370 [Polyangiaceae bacterium]
MVDTSEFATPAALDAVLRVHLEWTGGGVQSLPDEDSISPISGGYAFVRNEQVKLEPGCCCDLSDLAQWRAAFLAGPGPTPLLVGHGTYSIACRKGEVAITVFSEVRDQADVHFSCATDAFAAALAKAEQQQTLFARLLERRLRELGAGKRSTGIANCLVFGEDG